MKHFHTLDENVLAEDADKMDVVPFENDKDDDNEGLIQVICRIRLMSEQEKSAPERVMKSYKKKGRYISVAKDPILLNYKFTKVLSENTSQENVFKHLK